MARRTFARWIGPGCLLASRLLAQGTPEAPDLTALSIEQLMAIDVTSASKREEPLFRVPAAVFVITQDDLRRSGALSIPEALRMVPGMEVAQIDANKWEVSARGFNTRLSDKLLVLVDGRTVYTHIFSGVYWDTQDLMFEDVERIEVVRGPGATLWGANAVNGVINIITKSSRDTQGGLVVAGAGNLENAFGAVRYGGSAGDALTYRLFAKGFSRGDNRLPDGSAARDNWNSQHLGLRADWSAGSEAAVLQGDVYRVRTRERITELESVSLSAARLIDRDSEFHGGFGSLAWKHTFSERASASFAASYDVRMRDEVALRPHEEVLDLTFQHNLAIGRRQQVVWGLGYRRTTDDLPGSFSVSLTPERGKQTLASGYVQDDVTLVEDRLHAVAGVKVESYDGRSARYQPNFRLLWTPTARQTAWASYARALATPGRVDQAIRVNFDVFPGPGGTPVLVSVFGNPDLRQQEVVAYEAGYRIQATPSLSLDLAAFYNRYDELIAPVAGAPLFEPSPEPAHLVLPLRFENSGTGDTRGAELAASWNAAAGLRFRGAVTWLDMDLRFKDPEAGPAADTFGDGAELQASLRSSVDFAHDFGGDLTVYYVGHNPLEAVDTYWRVDLLGTWQPLAAFELAAGVRNLFDRRHLEVLDTTERIQPTLTPVSAYAKITWRF
ncbi:MAG: TonB-dependent receptor [Acidobacteriota bacterium]